MNGIAREKFANQKKRFGAKDQYGNEEFSGHTHFFLNLDEIRPISKLGITYSVTKHTYVL
jgi:hypothetical protein